MHGINTFVVGQRSKSQGLKQNLGERFISKLNRLNEQAFSNQTKTKHISLDAHSTRTKN